MAKYALNKVIGKRIIRFSFVLKVFNYTINILFLETLLCDQHANTIIGILGFLRQLVIVVIRGHSTDNKDNEDFFTSHKTTSLTNTEESLQILEIYDYCLYLVSSTPLSQHSIINAALEVIHSILQCLEGLTNRDKKNNVHLAHQLLQLITDKNLKHVNYLRNRDTIKQEMFNLKCFEDKPSTSVDGTQRGELINNLLLAL